MVTNFQVILSIARELNVKTDDVYEAIQALITEQSLKIILKRAQVLSHCPLLLSIE